jgi:hypothetical protein
VLVEVGFEFRLGRLAGHAGVEQDRLVAADEVRRDVARGPIDGELDTVDRPGLRSLPGITFIHTHRNSPVPVKGLVSTRWASRDNFYNHISMTALIYVW